MPERFLWSRLRGGQFGEFKLRRQFVIGKFVVDFAVPQLDLVIEIDGHSHDTTAVRDFVREQEIERLGWRIIRFSNDEVLTGIRGVMEAIENAMVVQAEKLGRTRAKSQSKRPSP